MAKIVFLGPIDLEPMDIESSDFDELRKNLNNIEALREWLPLCAVAINDNIIKDTNGLKINSNDVISLLPPVCGG